MLKFALDFGEVLTSLEFLKLKTFKVLQLNTYRTKLFNFEGILGETSETRLILM